MSRRTAVTVALAALLGAALPIAGAAGRVQNRELGRLMIGWRGWDDLALAVGESERGEYPVAPYSVTDRLRRDTDDFFSFRDRLNAQIAADRVAPTQFWRTLTGPWLTVSEWPVARRFDDSGRSVLLGLGFRLLGGVAPYLLPWLAVLGAAVACAWTAAELAAAGWRLAAVVFPVALALSAFVLDVLMVGYAAAGFQLVALLVVTAVAVYAVAGDPTMRGVAVRGVVAALATALCAFCRSATLMLLPGLAVALCIGVRRATAGAPSTVRGKILAGLGLAAAALAVALGAYQGLVAWTAARMADTAERHAMGRQFPPAHDVWITLWQGLGDFDRTKGHVYLDMAGERAVMEAGGHRRLGRRSELLLRKAILSEIRSDPAWFTAILVRRTWATVSLAKLWPRKTTAGTSIVPAKSENEGVTDTYYTMIAQADQVAFGGSEWELPGWTLLGPLVLLVVVAFVPLAGLKERRPIARRALLAVGAVSLSALATPVLITTASGFEAQMFVIVDVLALALVAQALAPSGPPVRESPGPAPEAARD